MLKKMPVLKRRDRKGKMKITEIKKGQLQNRGREKHEHVTARKADTAIITNRIDALR